MLDQTREDVVRLREHTDHPEGLLSAAPAVEHAHASPDGVACTEEFGRELPRNHCHGTVLLDLGRREVTAGDEVPGGIRRPTGRVPTRLDIADRVPVVVHIDGEREREHRRLDGR